VTTSASTRTRITKERVTVYCLCGASMTGWVSPRGYADPLKAAWLGIHPEGEDGHGPATKERALAARRRQREDAGV
jgi:hypothetical protein